MKKMALFLSCILTITCVFSQRKIKNRPTWKAVLFNNNVYRTYDNIAGIFIVSDDNKNYYYSDSEQTPTYTLDLDGREFIDYKIIREADGMIFFKVLPCAKLDKLNKKIIVEKEADGKCPSSGPDNATNYIFAVPSGKPITAFERMHLSSRLLLTPILHPIKYRPAFSGKEPTLTGEITLSFNVGYRLKLNRDIVRPVFLTIVPYGFGLSSSQYVKLNTNERAVPGNISLTYFSSGAFLSFDRYNVGLFLGKDAMVTKSQKDWHYQKQLWYSFGLGYSLK